MRIGINRDWRRPCQHKLEDLGLASESACQWCGGACENVMEQQSSAHSLVSLRSVSLLLKHSIWQTMRTDDSTERLHEISVISIERFWKKVQRSGEEG